MDETLEDLSHSYAIRLLNQIRAQVPVVNLELTSSYKQHGYDFKTIPDSFLANASVLQVDENDGSKHYTVHIPPEGLAGASPTLIDFFNQFVINNAIDLMSTLT